jgi:long-chain acyl-CoA synthetase
MRVLKPILRQLITHPFRIAIIDDQRTWKSFHLYLGALHLASAIEKATDRPRVGFMLPTSAMCPMAMIATWMLGRTSVPLNYLLSENDLAYVINDAELDTVITVGPMLDMFGELPPNVNALRLDQLNFKGLPRPRISKKRPDDHVAALLYTSGTSGKPKGVMLTSKNLASNVRQCVEWANFTNKDIMLGVLPQFHSFGLTVLTILPLTVGCKVINTARFMPKKILEPAQEAPADRAHRHPVDVQRAAQLKKLRRRPLLLPPLHRLRRRTAAPRRVRRLPEQFNVTINEGYGLTETSPVTHWCRPEDHKPRSSACALPGVETKIVDRPPGSPRRR